jgi:hypothetical protein
MAALMDQGDLEGAHAVMLEALPVLGRSAILVARADILACLMARRKKFQLSARLLGASEQFRRSCETARDPVERRCREEAERLLRSATTPELRKAWMEAGSRESEEDLAAAIADHHP